MKLIYRIAIRLSVVTMLLLAAWSAFFYYALVDEINDEADDALEDYSELLIVRMLAGQQLPDPVDGSNNSYSVSPVTEEYAARHPAIEYLDADVYIPEKDETEPARILKTIFSDRNGDLYELTVATPTFEKDDLLQSVLWWVVFLYAALLLTVVLLTVWVFYRSMKPLYVLLRWLDGYSVGDARPLHNDTRITEFRRLNEAAVKAAERADRLFMQQKEFIGNASHELQTPLAVCRNRLEWLLDNTELTEQQAGEIFQTLRTLDGIVRLNRTLLLLSKIENGQFADRRKLNAGNIVREQADTCAEIYASRNIRCEVTEAEPFVVEGDETLLSAIVGNLVKNAYVHTAPGGGVNVTVTAGGFTVTNDAESGPLDGEHIFRRFYQADAQRGTAGLGLALVEAACRCCGLKAEYSFLDGRHVFTVKPL